MLRREASGTQAYARVKAKYARQKPYAQDFNLRVEEQTGAAGRSCGRHRIAKSRFPQNESWPLSSLPEPFADSVESEQETADQHPPGSVAQPLPLSASGTTPASTISSRLRYQTTLKV